MNIEQSLTDHLRKLEEQLLQPEIRRSRERLDQLLADDFREFGSSERVYDKKQIIQALQDETPRRFSLDDFVAVPLAPEVVLVTYRATCTVVSTGTVTHSLRSSIWKKQNGQWRMLFHQGTRCERS
jgi:hypothetical protein